jgi:hypothetical protein
MSGEPEKIIMIGGARKIIMIGGARKIIMIGGARKNIMSGEPEKFFNGWGIQKNENGRGSPIYENLLEGKPAKLNSTIIRTGLYKNIHMGTVTFKKCIKLSH